MKISTPSTLFATILLFSATSAVAEPIPAAAIVAERQFNALTTKGCYSSSSGLSFNITFGYNSKGYCQTRCAPAGYSVQATTKSTDCWCGDSLPPPSEKVADSFCNDICAGYGSEMCGSASGKYFSVYLTGSGTVNGGADAVSSSVPSSAPSSTLSAKPSVVTVGGQTVVVTAPPNTSAASSSKSSGPSKAGIAAGVVVGIVAIAAIAGGVFLFLRNKKRREVEEEYKRNAAITSFVTGGKPPSSGGTSSFTDTRLDPVMAHRRMSDGSIADNQDYSRRILKVTNA